VWAAPELLGEPTIGGESARSGGGGGGGHRSQISLPNDTKTAKKRAFWCTFWLINRRKTLLFTQMYLTLIVLVSVATFMFWVFEHL
jgi:hypothetical protein